MDYGVNIENCCFYVLGFFISLLPVVMSNSTCVHLKLFLRWKILVVFSYVVYINIWIYSHVNDKYRHLMFIAIKIILCITNTINFVKIKPSAVSFGDYFIFIYSWLHDSCYWNISIHKCLSRNFTCVVSCRTDHRQSPTSNLHDTRNFIAIHLFLQAISSKPNFVILSEPYKCILLLLFYGWMVWFLVNLMTTWSGDDSV